MAEALPQQEASSSRQNDVIDLSGIESVNPEIQGLLSPPGGTRSPADKPTCLICLGMAGSGKTTFVQVSK